MKKLKYISFSPFLFALLTLTTVSYFVALNVANFLYKQVFNRGSGKPFCQRRCRNEKGTAFIKKVSFFKKRFYRVVFTEFLFRIATVFSAKNLVATKKKVIIYNRCAKYSFLSKFRGRLKKKFSFLIDSMITTFALSQWFPIYRISLFLQIWIQ